MTGRIVLLKGQSQYGSLRLHIDQAARGFQKLGYETQVLDLLDPQVSANVAGLLGEGEVHAIVSIAIAMDLRDKDGRNYSQLAGGAPHYCMMVDHPCAHLARLQNAHERVLVSFLDQSHVDWVNLFFPKGKFLANFLLPPGGNASAPSPVDDTVEDFTSRRDIQILATCSYHNASQLPWADQTGPIRDILDDAFEYCMAGDVVPNHEALFHVTEQRFGSCPDDLKQPLLQLCQQINHAVHGTRRVEALSQLARAGIPVTLYGIGWEPRMAEFASFNYCGEGTFEETLETLKRTRIVLNTNTNFVKGGHERVFAAQLAGAAVVSDYSVWYGDHYTDGEDMAMFRWTRPGELVEQVQRLMDEPELNWKIATAGRRKAEAAHCWEHRCRVILDEIEKVTG